MSDHQHDAAAAAAGSSHGNTNNPQQGAGRPLPKREADLFRSVVRQYESKQYKKAMKTADLVLKRFPNHGETLAMKGLIINAINYHAKRDEAHELVKRALTMDMRYVGSVVVDCRGVVVVRFAKDRLGSTTTTTTTTTTKTDRFGPFDSHASLSPLLCVLLLLLSFSLACRG
jgi:hypothetical protein